MVDISEGLAITSSAISASVGSIMESRNKTNIEIIKSRLTGNTKLNRRRIDHMKSNAQLVKSGTGVFRFIAKGLGGAGLASHDLFDEANKCAPKK